MNPFSQNPKELFLEAVEKYAPGDWGVFLDGACRGNSNLRDEVEALLKAHQESDNLFDLPPTIVDETPQVLVGAKIGPYKLLQKIGEGGFGVVYMAEQTAPVRRQVALKIIKPGMDSKEIIARFEAERQALALMDHMNIARVFDAGATEAGRPYFVMELVKGIPITQYCDRHHLNTADRLRLFVPVCHAVQHAHQKGVIHRDLKPSNILVTLYDGTPVPKVIDFGIAKATSQKLTEKTLFTAYGQFIGTPQYMSPEQSELGGLDIDTRADIYALGATLYELLSGSPLFDPERLRSAGFAEVMRIIREEEPLLPSKRLSTLGEASQAVARQRHTEPATLGRILRGDLDWIVMKAIEKDRSRRYPTPNDLADDIERHLNNQPVSAVAPSTWGYVSKFVRRNKVAVATGAAVGVTLVTCTIVSLLFAMQTHGANARLKNQIAETERHRLLADQSFQQARQVVDDYLTRVANDRRLAETMQPLRQELLDDARRYYEQFLQEHADDPELKEEYRHAMFQLAEVLASTGQRQPAKKRFQQLVTILQSELRTHPSNSHCKQTLALCYERIGMIELDVDNYEAAERSFVSSLRLHEELLSQLPHDTDQIARLAESNNRMAILMAKTYRPADALPYAERAAEALKPLIEASPDDADLLSQHGALENSIADAYAMQRDWSNSEEHLRLAIKSQSRAVELAPNDAGSREFLGNHHFNLGQLLFESGRKSEAQESFKAARGQFETLVQQNPTGSRWHYLLARCLMRLSDLCDDSPAEVSDSIRCLERAESLLAAQLELSPEWVSALSHLAQARHKLSLIHYQQGRNDLALERRLWVVDATRRLIELDPLNERSHRENLARSLLYAGTIESERDNHVDADRHLTECDRQYAKLLKANPGSREYRSLLGQCLNSHGLQLVDAGEFDRAVASYNRAEALLNGLVDEESVGSDDAVRLGGVYCNRGHLEFRRGKLEAAVAAYDRAAATLTTILAEQPRHTTAGEYLYNALSARTSALEESGKYDRAIKSCEDAYAKATVFYRQSFRLRKAYLLARLGRHSEAARTVEQLLGTVNLDSGAEYNLAQVYALSARAAAADDAELALQYSDKACHWLERCLQAGVTDIERIESENDFTSIRDTAAYKRLMITSESSPETPRGGSQ